MFGGSSFDWSREYTKMLLAQQARLSKLLMGWPTDKEPTLMQEWTEKQDLIDHKLIMEFADRKPTVIKIRTNRLRNHPTSFLSRVKGIFK